MEEHRKKGSSRRGSDRRGNHRRSEHRRKSNIDVDNERRKNVDQRKGYQRKENRRSGEERRNLIIIRLKKGSLNYPFYYLFLRKSIFNSKPFPSLLRNC